MTTRCLSLYAAPMDRSVAESSQLAPLAAPFMVATLVCSNGDDLDDLRPSHKWSGGPCGPKLVSSTAGLKKLFDAEEKRSWERHQSLSSSALPGPSSPSPAQEQFWMVTLLAHSKEISTSAKHTLKMKRHATVGDLVLAYMDSLVASGGSLVVYCEGDSSYTTAFAMYSSRKIDGCPLNASDRMCQALNTELETSAGGGESMLKAIVHVFHARRMEHWNAVKGNLNMESIRPSILIPLGSKWEKIGLQPPVHGTEIFHQALSSGLKSKLVFSKEEFENFRVPNLSFDTYIKADDEYFIPAVLRNPTLGKIARIARIDPGLDDGAVLISCSCMRRVKSPTP